MSSNVAANIWFAGAFAGVSVNLLVFPLDTLKTRLQSPAFQQTYRSAQAIADRALWRNLYQGVGSAVLITVPSSGVFFTTYEGLEHVLGASTATPGTGLLPQPAVHALSSSIAQLVNCAVVTPAEVLKQNAQMLSVSGSPSRGNNRMSSSPTMVVLQQLKRNPTKLWSGYTALAARDLPFTALQFPAYEYLKTLLTARRSRLTTGGRSVEGVIERAWVAAISAGVAGSVAAWVTTPFDVVKTRMMLEAGTKGSLGAESGSGIESPDGGERRRRQGKRSSALQIGRDVLRYEGIRGLFRGGMARGVFTIFGNGLYMGCYEGAKIYLQAR